MHEDYEKPRAFKGAEREVGRARMDRAEDGGTSTAGPIVGKFRGSICVTGMKEMAVMGVLNVAVDADVDG